MVDDSSDCCDCGLYGLHWFRQHLKRLIDVYGRTCIIAKNNVEKNNRYSSYDAKKKVKSKMCLYSVQLCD